MSIDELTLHPGVFVGGVSESALRHALESFSIGLPRHVREVPVHPVSVESLHLRERVSPEMIHAMNEQGVSIDEHFKKRVAELLCREIGEHIHHFMTQERTEPWGDVCRSYELIVGKRGAEA